MISVSQLVVPNLSARIYFLARCRKSNAIDDQAGSGPNVNEAEGLPWREKDLHLGQIPSREILGGNVP